MLVEVAKKVLQTHPDWQWHVYGTGETFDEISNKILEYHLKEQLILKGNVENVFRLYSEYAFLVLPSYREGLPLVLLEALSAGIPMISFDIETGPNEIIEHGKNGFLVPPYNIDKMAEYIIELMEDEERRCHMAGQTKAEDKFKKENILKQWIALLEE